MRRKRLEDPPIVLAIKAVVLTLFLSVSRVSRLYPRPAYSIFFSIAIYLSFSFAFTLSLSLSLSFFDETEKQLRKIIRKNYSRQSPFGSRSLERSELKD